MRNEWYIYETNFVSILCRKVSFSFSTSLYNLDRLDNVVKFYSYRTFRLYILYKFGCKLYEKKSPYIHISLPIFLNLNFENELNFELHILQEQNNTPRISLHKKRKSILLHRLWIEYYVSAYYPSNYIQNGVIINLFNYVCKIVECSAYMWKLHF